MNYEVLAFERLKNNTDIILKKEKDIYLLQYRYALVPVKTKKYSNEIKAYKAFEKEISK